MQLVRILVLLAGLFFLLIGMFLLWGLQNFPLSWLDGYLIGATLMAYGVPTLWIGATRSYKALVGGGLSALVTFGGVGIFLLRLSLVESAAMQLGEFCLYIAILAIWFFFLGLRVSKKKLDRLPITTQWLFAFVLTVALLEGLYLVIPLPGHFPWLLTPELAVIYGWILIGGSLFFGWCLVQPIWENGYPLLYALLVYNGLLIGPYLSLLKEPSHVAVVPIYLWFAILMSVISGIWALVELIGRFFTVRKS